MALLLTFAIAVGHLFATEPFSADQNIEVFDADKGAVIKILRNSADVQREVGKLLNDLDFDGKLAVDLSKGTFIKIPLAAPKQINNSRVNEPVKECILILQAGSKPNVMLLTKSQTYIFTTKRDLTKLLAFMEFDKHPR